MATGLTYAVLGSQFQWFPITIGELLLSNATGMFIQICWAAFLLYFFVSAFFTKRTAEYHGFGWGWRIVAIAALIAIVAALKYGGELPQFIGMKVWQYSLPIGIAADFVALLGLAVVLWARYTLGGNWSGTVTLKENHELIMTGPYAYVRHPIYLGLLLLMLGTAVQLGLLAGFAVLIIGIVGLWGKANAEEKLMEMHFPKEYPEYRGRTKAIIPFLF